MEGRLIMIKITPEQKYDYRILNYLPMIKSKMSCGNKYDCKIGVLEFHPTNNCNLQCKHCTYKFRNNRDVYPFEQLENLRRLNPQALVLSGGGEPTFYSYGSKNFNDLVLAIRNCLPEVKIGLTTNGQVIVNGNWIHEMDWIRISVDTVDEHKFMETKGGSLGACLESLRYYLVNSRATVGIGFVYNNGNLDEIADFNKKIYSYLIQEGLKEYLYKINVQYRPTCQIESCNCPSKRYTQENIIMVSDKEKQWQNRERAQKEKILGDADIFFLSWVKKVTNLDLETNSERLFRYDNSLTNFHNCYYALVRNMLTPTGELYPCVVKATNNATPIGNILTDTDEEIFKGQQNYFLFNTKYCHGSVDCCRFFAKRNYYAEVAIKSPEFCVPDYIKDSPFM